MKPQTIKAIFTNLLFIIGVILTVVGFIQSTRTIARLIIFDKYPLATYEETRCNFGRGAIVPPIGEGVEPVSSSKTDETKEECLASLEHERKVRVVEDIVTSFSTLVSGVVLVVSFRRFIFK